MSLKEVMWDLLVILAGVCQWMLLNRIRCYSQEIVIFREEVLELLGRNSVRSQEGDPCEAVSEWEEWNVVGENSSASRSFVSSESVNNASIDCLGSLPSSIPSAEPGRWNDCLRRSWWLDAVVNSFSWNTVNARWWIQGPLVQVVLWYIIPVVGKQSLVNV